MPLALEINFVENRRAADDVEETRSRGWRDK